MSPPTAPRNPTDAYPKPPFPRQSQDWPGLQSKMTPRPDCGEQSYRGTARLLGRKALITGGDSGIGRDATYKTNIYALFWLSKGQVYGASGGRGEP
jgi:hypothetical protein